MYVSSQRPLAVSAWRTLLAAFAVLALVMSALGVAAPTLATHGGAHLNPDHAGTSWDDPNFECDEDDLDRVGEGEVLWHFVLTQSEASSGQLTATFENAGTVTVDSERHTGGVLHFSIITGQDTLLDAQTDVAGANLNLSHICVGEDEEPPPPPEENGFLEIDKILCPGTGDPVFEVIAEGVGPQSLQSEEDNGCTTTDASFHVIPAGETEPIDTVTTVNGTITFELAAGDYYLVEVETGAQSDVFTVVEGALTIVLVTNFEGEQPEENGNLKVIKWFCEGEGPDGASVIFEVLDGDVAIPNLENCELGEATFTLNDPNSETTYTTEGGVLWIDNVPVGVTHTLFEISPNTGSVEFMIPEADAWVTIFAFNFEGEQPEETGSITIQKAFEEGECPVCPTRTPGFWFNRGGGGGVSLANELLPGLNVTFPIGEGGSTTFDSVATVHAFIDWDLSGGDGEIGLSGTAQLLRQYLALLLNVTVTDCPWDEIMFGDMSVADWLEAARQVLLAGGEDEEIKDALDAINNASHGDGTLECPEGATGSLAGFTFELWLDDVLIDSMETDASGSVTFTDLELGQTYTIVEVSPDGLECTIVDVMDGDNVVLNPDGTISVTLTEDDPDVTLTVVNECEAVEEEEGGEITVIKQTDPAETDATFTFDASYYEDSFVLGSGQSDTSGELMPGEHTVTETVPDGWELASVVCDDGAWSFDGGVLTIDLMAGDSITCIFLNVLADVEEDEGFLEIDKILCPGEGETTFEVLGIVGPTDVGAMSAHECETMDATFVVTPVGADEPWGEVTTVNGTVTFAIPAGDYILTETETGAMSGVITVEEGMLTIVLVTNFEGEGEQPGETGNLKVVKWFCEGGDEGTVRFEVLDGDAVIPNPAGCELGEATFALNDAESEDTFTTEGGILWLTNVPVGVEHTLFEVSPNEGSVAFTIPEADAWVTVFAFNFVGEGEQPGGEQPGGQQPGEGEMPGVGGPGMGVLPDTALPTSGLPAGILAVLMLGGLGALGYRGVAAARARR